MGPILFTARAKRCEPYLTTKAPTQTQNLNVKFITSIATGNDVSARQNTTHERSASCPSSTDGLHTASH